MILQRAILVALIGVGIPSLGDGAEPIDFNRDVRPILSDKCFNCHGPDEGERQGGGERGLRLDVREGALADLGGQAAVVPGRAEESELVRRILATGDDVMPPADHRKKLTDREKGLLVEWVQQGAEWADHWSFIAPRRAEPPRVTDPSWPRTFIDHFILARFDREELQPSPDADKRTLLRRLSFDLIGLPPSEAEVQAFLDDSSNKAWEAAVDRLLASKHFGERLAMYWLDLVRYADTVGYHGDQNVSVSPYRDYVINALNNNMPFDRFTREQLAGDLLPNPTRDQLVASGYNKLGMMSAEGGVQPKEYLAKYAADRVRTVSTVWLGSTVGCSECHDHKFDPFRTKDFYQLASFFADIKERGLYAGAHADGNWGPTVEVANDELPALLTPIDQQIEKLHTVLDTPTPELAAAQSRWEEEFASTTTRWQTFTPEKLEALHGTTLARQDDGSVLAGGTSPVTNIYSMVAASPTSKLTGLRLEVLPDDSLPRKGPGRAGNGNFVVTEVKVFVVAENGEESPITLQNASASIEQTLAGEVTPDKKWSAASAIDGDVKGEEWGWAVLPEIGKPQQMVVETAEAMDVGSAKLKVVLEQRHGTNHTLGRFRISLTSSLTPLQANGNSLPQDVAAALAVSVDKRAEDEATVVARYYRSIAPVLNETRKQLADWIKQRDAAVKQHTRTSLITVSVEPREMRVLPRGNWMDDSGEVVQPAVPSFLRQIETDGRANRLHLARWLTARDNPLTARVFVNRLWKMYFGTGLSKVLDDVGAQGEWPTHPELLDTLAVEFMDHDWNVKHMVKLLVMSRTYRQSSLMRDELRDRDPYNRLLARQSRFRFDAEIVRDNMLAVSGLLVRKVGGRSVKPYQPAGLYRHLNFPARTYKHDEGDGQYRRGLYTHWQRQFLHPAMKAFDAPPREECTAERMRSNTPLAALAMLNDPSAVEAARAFAEWTVRASTGDTATDIDAMLRQALSRPADPQEVEILSQLLTSQRQHYAAHKEHADQLVQVGLHKAAEEIDAGELAAWTSVARAIFNMHEFITRN